MVDVGGQDGPAARDLVADELGRHALAQRHELHLRRDLAASRVVHLGHAPPGRRAQRRPHAGKAHAAERGVALALPTVERRRTWKLLDVGTPEDPAAPQRRQPLLDVDVGLEIRVRPARVVETHGRLAAGQGDLAHGNPQIIARPGYVDLVHWASLRRYYPGQVLAVGGASPPSQPGSPS